MGIDIDFIGISNARFLYCHLNGSGAAQSVRVRRSHMVGVVGIAISTYLTIYMGAPRCCMLIFLQHDNTGAFTHHKTAAPLIKGNRSAGRVRVLRQSQAIKLALGEAVARKAHISSTKSMTGHMLGAAGGVEAIATVLALKNGVIPPTIGYAERDPECDLDYTPNRAVQAAVTLGLSTSLGFGGHNGCLAFRKFEP